MGLYLGFKPLYTECLCLPTQLIGGGRYLYSLQRETLSLPAWMLKIQQAGSYLGNLSLFISSV